MHLVNYKTELERICALPVYDPNWQAPDLTDLFRRPGGTMRLLPAQSKAIYYAVVWRGFVGFLPVGTGKTLTSLLITLALNAKRPLLLIPPSQRADLRKQWETFTKHFYLPTNLTVQSYEMLSSPDSTAFLTANKFDVIVCDEGQKLKDRKSTRTRRFLRYMQANPDVVFCVMSGSLTNRSVKDYSHLAACALGTNSPLPLKHGELEDFALAIDVQRNAINELDLDYLEARGLRQDAIKRLGKLCDKFGTDDIREAYQRRLTSNPGVVVIKEASVNIPVTITERSYIKAPEIIQRAIKDLDDNWVTPSGEELCEVLEYIQARNELAQGYYSRWVWPNGIEDKEWLDGRQGWFRAVRSFLPHSKEGSDSPALAEQAVRQNRKMVPKYLADAYDKWLPVKDRPTPPSEVIWLDPYLIFDAVEWGRKHDPALIWYSAIPVGSAIATVGGFAYADTGSKADEYIASLQHLDNPPTLVLSIKAHGTGKNLQAYRRNLVVAPPSNGLIWEQLIGRTRRKGQKAKLIEVSVNTHLPFFKDALRKARQDAEYAEESTTSPQILNLANYVEG